MNSKSKISYGMETNQPKSNITLPLNLQPEKSELYKMKWQLKYPTYYLVPREAKTIKGHK